METRVAEVTNPTEVRQTGMAEQASAHTKKFINVQNLKNSGKELFPISFPWIKIIFYLLSRESVL